MRGAGLELENVCYTYGRGTPFEICALNGVNASFTPGVITGIIGHTGSGKSTLAQLLNGLLRPDSGRVLFDGKDIWEDPKKIVSLRFRVGLVFQYPEYQLFEETVRRDIAFGPKNMKKSPEEIERLVESAARFAGIPPELLDKSPFELSGGQKRRAAIAGVMAMDPEIIVFDEPAAGLDPGGRDAVFGGIREYQRKFGKTVIMISHSMEDMARFSDELLVLRDGRDLAAGSVESVFSRSELLESSGLALPQISSLMLRLKREGVPVSAGVYTPEAACREIISALGRVQKTNPREDQG